MMDQSDFDDDQNDDHDKNWVDYDNINLFSDLSKVETLEARLHSEPQLKNKSQHFSIFCQSDLVLIMVLLLIITMVHHPS